MRLQCFQQPLHFTGQSDSQFQLKQPQTIQHEGASGDSFHRELLNFEQPKSFLKLSPVVLILALVISVANGRGKR